MNLMSGVEGEGDVIFRHQRNKSCGWKTFFVVLDAEKNRLCNSIQAAATVERTRLSSDGVGFDVAWMQRGIFDNIKK